MGLFKPIWMKDKLNWKEKEKAEEQVKRLEGKKLIKVATKAPDSDIRKIAVMKLTDQTALRGIARNDVLFGKLAYDKLSGEIDYADYAQNARDSVVYRAAMEKVTDREVLSEIARKSNDPYRRESAVKNLTDQKVLSEVARKDTDEKVREAAAYKVTDQAALAEIALKDESARIRLIAMRRLTDQKALSEVARKDESWEVREAAVKKITDQKMLSEIIREEGNDRVRKAALENLTDREVLSEIARNGDWNVAKLAFDRLTGEIDHADYALNAKEMDVRKAAIERMTVPPVTMDFYREYISRFPNEMGVHHLADLLEKLAAAGDAAAVEELGGWLSEPDRAELAAEKLNKVYKKTREGGIRRYCGHYQAKHFDYNWPSCDGGGHSDEYPDLHFDLK